ncbi:hypothetical protein HK098_002288 [Nowakowskiella sp. JEL0407]|nr:hypothetical protein HK098_002288 [Nowakowskiella sp. JEL0407]
MFSKSKLPTLLIILDPPYPNSTYELAPKRAVLTHQKSSSELKTSASSPASSSRFKFSKTNQSEDEIVNVRQIRKVASAQNIIAHPSIVASTSTGEKKAKSLTYSFISGKVRLTTTRKISHLKSLQVEFFGNLLVDHEGLKKEGLEEDDKPRETLDVDVETRPNELKKKKSWDFLKPRKTDIGIKDAVEKWIDSEFRKDTIVIWESLPEENLEPGTHEWPFQIPVEPIDLSSLPICYPVELPYLAIRYGISASFQSRSDLSRNSFPLLTTTIPISFADFNKYELSYFQKDSASQARSIPTPPQSPPQIRKLLLRIERGISKPQSFFHFEATYIKDFILGTTSRINMQLELKKDNIDDGDGGKIYGIKQVTVTLNEKITYRSGCLNDTTIREPPKEPEPPAAEAKQETNPDTSTKGKRKPDITVQTTTLSSMNALTENSTRKQDLADMFSRPPGVKNRVPSMRRQRSEPAHLAYLYRKRAQIALESKMNSPEETMEAEALIKALHQKLDSDSSGSSDSNSVQHGTITRRHTVSKLSNPRPQKQDSLSKVTSLTNPFIYRLSKKPNPRLKDIYHVLTFSIPVNQDPNEIIPDIELDPVVSVTHMLTFSIEYWTNINRWPANISEISLTSLSSLEFGTTSYGKVGEELNFVGVEVVEVPVYITLV